MAILTFEQKHDFWKRPFNLSTQNLLCIEYGHLDLSRDDLGKLYTPPCERRETTNFPLSQSTQQTISDMNNTTAVTMQNTTL